MRTSGCRSRQTRLTHAIVSVAIHSQSAPARRSARAKSGVPFPTRRVNTNARSRLAGSHLRCLMFGRQRIDDLVQGLPGHHFVKLV